MASAVTAKLDFGPEITALLPRFWQGEGVMLRATFAATLTGAPVDPDAITVIARYPSGAVVAPPPALTRVSAGVYTFVVLADAVDRWQAEVSCSLPDAARAVREFVAVARPGQTANPSPAPQGAVQLVNGYAPDANGNVQIPVGTPGAIKRINGQVADGNGDAAVTAEHIDWTPPWDGAVARKASVEFSSRAPLPENFGAVGNGVADDYDACTAWLNKAAEAGVRVVENGRGIYNLYSRGLIIPRNVTVRGDFNPGAARFDRRFDNMPGTFVHDGTNPVFIRFGGKLEGCCVVGSDLFGRGEINSAAKLLATRHAWAGTGVQIGAVTGQQQQNGTDGEAEGVFAVGFDRCFASINASRSKLTNCMAEGRDAFYIQGSFDFGWMTGCGAPMVVGGFTSFAGRWFIVTGAANNGSGGIRLTVVANASGLSMSDMADGYYVRVAEVGGVPNATGIWQVTVIDSTHIDLVGSTWGGAYTSGGRCFPQLNWSRGTAFSVIDTDGYAIFGCQSNNYTVGYYVDRTVASFTTCNSEGYNFPLPGVHIGFKAAPSHGNVIWSGGSIGAFTNKIFNRCTGRVVFAGAYFPSSGSSGAVIEQHGGRLFVNAGALAGRVNVGDGSKRMGLVGASEGSVSVTGTPAGLSTVAMIGSTEAGQGEVRLRGVRARFWGRHLTSGAERLALDIDYDRLRLFNDVEVWVGRGSPEGVVPGRRGALFLKGDATAERPGAIKLTSAASPFGWAWINVTPIPPVLDSAVKALLDYASAGEGVVSGGALHPEAVFTRAHDGSDRVATAGGESVWSEVAANVPRFFGPERRLVIEGLPVTNLFPGSRCLGAIEAETDEDVSTPPTGWSVSYPGGLVAKWAYDVVDGLTGVTLLLTGTTTSSSAIIINGSGSTVALGAVATAFDDTRAASAITKVIEDDEAVTSLTCGLQFLTTAGGTAGGASASWHADRLTLAQRGGVAKASNASTGGARVRLTSNTIAADVTMTWRIFIADMMIADSASIDLPVLPPDGTAAVAGHNGEALEIAADAISIAGDGECSFYMACITRRASLAGVDQVLLRIGGADDCYMVFVAAGGNSLQYRRVIGGTPDTAVTLGTVVPGTEFGFVFSATGAGLLSGAIVAPANTLQTQSGTAISGVADVYAGVASVIEIRALSGREGVPA